MTNPSNGVSGGWKLALQIAAPVAVAVLLPGVGFIASEVIQNGKDIAVLQRSTMTPENALQLVRAHEMGGVHNGAVTQDRLTHELAQQEKQSTVRFEAIQRELADIKAQLRELAKRDK